MSRVYCDKCGCDITEKMKFINDKGTFCYDCNEILRNKDIATMTIKERIKRMYKAGRRVADIAEITHLTKKEVYEILDGVSKYRFDRAGNIVDAKSGKIVRKRKD